MTSAQPLQPNFLIVGAAKSGTTSLYNFLKQHPDVFMPDWKEPAFFAPKEAGGVQSKDEYLALFKAAGSCKAVGEASVSYMIADNAAQKIKDFLGRDVKIIMLLRNPVDMAYSNWGHQTREGYEQASFERAIEEESQRPVSLSFRRTLKTWIKDVLYVERASYPDQIKHYDAVFPNENIRIYTYEEFFQNGLPYWGELCDFLGIDPEFRPESRVYNAAGGVRSRYFQSLIRDKSHWKDVLKLFIPKGIRWRIKTMLDQLNRTQMPLPEMQEETRLYLQKIFADDVRWLEQRMGKSLKTIWFDYEQ